jgi:LPXTG-motif cell wall-anchored protein
MPVNAANITTCPTCAPQKFVYVTVTQAPQIVYVTVPQIIYVTPTPELNIMTKLTDNFNYIYGGLFSLLLIGLGIIVLRKKRKKPVPDENTSLYEEPTSNPDLKPKLKLKPKPELEYKPKPEPELVNEPEKKKSKKPKLKSLLDQDFEF